jgi:hypothetical protein
MFFVTCWPNYEQSCIFKRHKTRMIRNSFSSLNEDHEDMAVALDWNTTLFKRIQIQHIVPIQKLGVHCFQQRFSSLILMHSMNTQTSFQRMHSLLMSLAILAWVFEELSGTPKPRIKLSVKIDGIQSSQKIESTDRRDRARCNSTTSYIFVS